MFYGVLFLSYFAYWCASWIGVSEASAAVIWRLVLAAGIAAVLWQVVKQMRVRLAAGLTRKEPKMPVGIKRRVVLDAETCTEDLSSCTAFELYWWLADSVMIVTYEHCVQFIDSSADPADSKGFVLSSQEKQHALVHGKYNRAHLEACQSGLPAGARLVFAGYDAFLRIVPVVCKLLPDLVHGMVAITENGFFYSYERKELFRLFFDSDLARAAPLLGRIFAWHFAEEREHCSEATALFSRQYGWLAPIIVLLSVPNVTLFFGTVTLTALLASAAASPKSLLRNSAAFVAHVVHQDALIAISALLLLAGLSASDAHVDEELNSYRKSFQERTGLDLRRAELNLSSGLPTRSKLQKN